jgi:phage internal scaffolding protein
MSMRLRQALEREVPRAVTKNEEPSMTRQSEADACDINRIVAQFGRGAELTHVNPAEPVYADVSDMPSIAEAFAVVQSGQAAFQALDSKIRKRFDNNPVLFLEFLANPSNRGEAIDLGLVNPAELSDDDKAKAIERRRRAARRAVDAEEDAARGAAPPERKRKADK